MKAPLVFLFCTGLGRINRGYETFTRECFDLLKTDPNLDLQLYKGAGPNLPNEHTVPHLHRNTSLAKTLARLLGKDGYFVEQFTFFLFFLFPILFKRPTVIYYSDFLLGSFLFRFKKVFGLKYKLLFTNGAPNGPPFSSCDYVQQLLPSTRQWALDAGEPEAKHFLLPLGCVLPTEKVKQDKNRLRLDLGLPLDKKIILSVGAINKHHKRMDYLIQEVSKLDPNDYFLVVLGQQGEESEEVIALAKQKIPHYHMIKTVGPDEMDTYYQAADLFVLCSIVEGFGRVYIEALTYGLPVIAHDFGVSRDVLGPMGYFANLKMPGTLWQLIEEISTVPDHFTEERKKARKNYAQHNYSWEALRPAYLHMLLSVAHEQPS